MDSPGAFRGGKGGRVAGRRFARLASALGLLALAPPLGQNGLGASRRVVLDVNLRQLLTSIGGLKGHVKGATLADVQGLPARVRRNTVLSRVGALDHDRLESGGRAARVRQRYGLGRREVGDG
jgi:hypothetical protein